MINSVQLDVNIRFRVVFQCMKRLDVFTDGGCSGNPGPGGWAFVIISNGEIVTSSGGGEKETTNNIMELTAVINSLKACSLLGDYDEIFIFTDSQYVQNGITQWIENWKKNGWKTASKKPVKNRELWEELDALNHSGKIRWNWVKGHAGIMFNEMCDSMVRAEMQRFL